MDPESWPVDVLLTPHVRRLIDMALDEDAVGFDPASAAVFGAANAHAWLVAKSDLVLAGQAVFGAVFQRIDPAIDWTFDVPDGTSIGRGTRFARADGAATSLLLAERTALNFLQRMSGVATLTRSYVDALSNDSIRLADTRKTLPGYRLLDKYSVRCGGGFNHRFSLSSGTMVKDNHIAAAGGLEAAVSMARTATPHMLRIEVEIAELSQVPAALRSGAEVVMLDNMSNEVMRQAISELRAARPDIVIEASGNVTVERLPELGALDLDVVSVGALTHSATAADISMQLETSS